VIATSTVALLGVAASAGCQLIVGLRDIELVEAGSGEMKKVDAGDAGHDRAVIADAPSEADQESSVDAPPEAGVSDAAYGSPSLELIDDMENGSGTLPMLGGRTGLWFTYSDPSATGEQTPRAGTTFYPSVNVPPRPIPENLGGGVSDHAAQTSGHGFAIWGAGMGFNFSNPRAPYDASSYVGFTFWGRIGSTLGTADAGVSLVRLNVPDTNTDSAGGVCTSCSDYLGKDFIFTSEWQEFTVLFSQLAQSGFGKPYETALAATSVYGCQFLVTTDPDVGNAGAPFDVWIDDIYFITKESQTDN
jgi:hypothetical protein